MQEPDNHGFGRERGGWGSKLHLVVDGNDVPLSALITPGQRNESTVFEQAMDGEKIGRKKRPKAVAGDKGYDAKRIRDWCRSKKIRCVIPQRKAWRPGQQRRRRLDKTSYRKRNVVERCVGWLKRCRRVGTRYEKLAIH